MVISAAAAIPGTTRIRVTDGEYSGHRGILMIGKGRLALFLIVFAAIAIAAAGTIWATHATGPSRQRFAHPRNLHPRNPNMDLSGYTVVSERIEPWAPDASLLEIAGRWHRAGYRALAHVEAQLAEPAKVGGEEMRLLMLKSQLLLYEGEADRSYETLSTMRSRALADEKYARNLLATVIFAQGVAALRKGENDNCIMCRGDSSCIFPISAAAVHTDPTGSRLAIRHFTEYLELFPDDLGVRWLLNLAHMTLGEFPGKVDRRFRLDLDRFLHSEFDIGKFREVSHAAGFDRSNQAGGAIMDDFDNDGRLDVVVTSTDPTQPMAFYHNKGDGTFGDRTRQAGVSDQLGGLVCYQADYDNDGFLDIFIPRGAWCDWPIRPTLLRNNRAGGFTDVTKAAGLLDPVNSNAAAWGDFDNDGWVDLYVACEHQHNRLYRNRRDGSFEELAVKAGVEGDSDWFCKGCTWIDYDNDGYSDLFVNCLQDSGRLYHNERDGRFTEVTTSMGIDGPHHGFSCWAWDYDNDGWMDIFATSIDRELSEVVKGILGRPRTLHAGRLFRNLQGQGFENRTAESGLDLVFAPMGSNFADFDNDGWLDFYLGTGEPNPHALVPNRMFKNVDGVRFADITSSSRTGHLQKGHAVACGDWDRDGDVDLFVETGGAVNGDKYHNLLFENPGQKNHSLTLKLVGRKTNRAAIGARIKLVTAGEPPLTIHRLVSSGSSFGANALEQTIGLAGAVRVASLEIHWPTSETTQIFRDITADQAIEVTEYAENYRRLDWKPVLSR
jgi:hypothetical protein